MNTSDVLIIARQRISDPQNWIREYLAVDSRGFQVRPGEPEACRFCALGAVHNAAPQNASYGARAYEVLKAHRALLDVLPWPWLGAVHRFNDSVEHEEVLALFDRAIVKALNHESNQLTP